MSKKWIKRLLIVAILSLLLISGVGLWVYYQYFHVIPPVPMYTIGVYNSDELPLVVIVNDTGEITFEGRYERVILSGGNHKLTAIRNGKQLDEIEVELPEIRTDSGRLSRFFNIGGGYNFALLGCNNFETMSDCKLLETYHGQSYVEFKTSGDIYPPGLPVENEGPANQYFFYPDSLEGDTKKIESYCLKKVQETKELSF